MDNNQLNKAKAYKNILVEELNVILKPNQFKRKGNKFVKVHNDLNYYITVQSSQSSTSNLLKATVNIEISSSKLLPSTFDPIHFRKRIGFFLDIPFDKWWLIDNEQSAIDASVEINKLTANKILLELSRFQTTSDLVELWSNGISPGLTDFQRKTYLSQLSDLA